MKNLILTVANLAAYAVVAMALFALSPAAELSLPWWVALTAPAIVYTLLVVMCCPRANTAEAIGVVALLFVAHAALASATGMVYAAFSTQPYPLAFATAAWEYLPAPVLQLLCVSVLVLPFRALYAAPRARRRGRFAASAAAPAPELPPSPFEMPDVTLPEASPVALAAAPEGVGGAGSHSGMPAPIAGGSRREGAERVEEVVSIPFSRIADQLPAGAFTIPPDRLGANLLEPGHLLVPTRLVVPQLAEGFVTVRWEEVADQFPRHALAVNEATVRDGLPEGRIVLPLDEVVRRLPPEMFMPSMPSADLQGIDRFPLPFRPLEPDPVLPEPAQPAPAAPAPPVAAAPPAPAAPPVPAMPITPPAAAPVPDEPDVLEVEAAATPAAERMPVGEEPDAGLEAEYIPPFLSGESEIEYGLASRHVDAVVLDEPPAMIEPDVAEPVAAPKPPVVEPVAVAKPPVVAAPPPPSPPPPPPPAEELRPAAEAPRAPAIAAEQARQANQLAAVLTPFGKLEVSTTGIEGVTLFTFASGALPMDAVLRSAGSILPFLMSGRAPWPVDQLTVRREGGAIIITPLGPIEAGGPAMVASVGRVGSLALLEIVCLKAAREHRAAYPAAPRRSAAPASEPDAQYETRAAGGLSLGFLAGDLDAFGPVTPTVLRDTSGGSEVCVFLAPGGDSRAVAGFSVAVCRALVPAGDEPSLGPLQSVTFRLGDRRLVVRPVKGTPGRFSVLVAAGEAVDRPGLAHRQLERAAALLRGV